MSLLLLCNKHYWWPKVLYQLLKKKCPKNLFQLIESYFSNRNSSLWYLNLEVKEDIDIGCPQGSASGPWYWNIFYDDIFDLSDNNTQIIGFADDTLLMFSAQTIEELQIIANSKLNEISNWGTANKLNFNLSKTKCLLFTRRLKYNNPRIEFSGKVLELSNNFEYLGLTIDTKLTWRSH